MVVGSSLLKAVICYFHTSCSPLFSIYLLSLAGGRIVAGLAWLERWWVVLVMEVVVGILAVRVSGLVSLVGIAICKLLSVVPNSSYHYLSTSSLVWVVRVRLLDDWMVWMIGWFYGWSGVWVVGWVVR